ncbi:hypothetical protein IW150_004821 [Coemansia sp. RSA 2607]|nr:hypothetical protein IW150_004821 [Coemansia sp. RSA 2607]
MKVSFAASILATATVALVLTSGAYASPVEQEHHRTIVGRAVGNSNLVIVTETVTVTADISSPADSGPSSSSEVVEEEEGTSVDSQTETAEETEAEDTSEQQSSAPTTQAEEQTSAAEVTEPAEESQSQSTQQETAGETTDTASGGSGGGGSTAEVFSGDGTYFSPGLGSCGLTNTDSDLIVAINAPQYGTTANPNNAPICNQCILAKGPKGEVKVTVTDRCPVCKSGDLDFSPSAFEKIADFDQGRVPITWSFVDC